LADELDHISADDFDDDGGCYVAIFAGPAAEQRATTNYRDALSARLLVPVSVTPNLS
jgi:hypothetical protein